MFLEYFYWHYILTPRFIFQLFWNIEKAILQFFSVPLLLRTLVAHWHKDAVAYTGGTISAYAMAFAWNLISRGIGFFIRLLTLSLWLATEVIFFCMAGSFLLGFLVLPLLIIFAFISGIILVLQ